MGPLDAMWHLLNFLAPAVAVGALSAALAKLLWRRHLATVRWRRLASWAGGAAATALVGGLIGFGRDGMMATYAAMVLANTLALWAAGFGPLRR